MSDTKIIRDLLQYTQAIASRSKDPRRKVGCIAAEIDPIKHYNGPYIPVALSTGDIGSVVVLAAGFNFLPEHLDWPSVWEDKPVKNKFVVHAERAMLANAARTGVRLVGSAVFVTDAPCLECAKSLVGVGFTSMHVGRMPMGSWHDECAVALNYLDQAGTSVAVYDENAPEQFRRSL